MRLEVIFEAVCSFVKVHIGQVGVFSSFGLLSLSSFQCIAVHVGAETVSSAHFRGIARENVLVPPSSAGLVGSSLSPQSGPVFA